MERSSRWPCSRILAATAVTELELRRELADHARVERALRDSEERFRSLVDQTSDIIAIVDERGVVRYGSPSVESVLGYDAEELVGRNALDLIHREDRRRVRDAHLAAMRDPWAGQEGVEFRFRHKNGYAGVCSRPWAARSSIAARARRPC